MVLSTCSVHATTMTTDLGPDDDTLHKPQKVTAEKAGSLQSAGSKHIKWKLRAIVIGKGAQAAEMAPALRGFSRRFKLRTCGASQGMDRGALTSSGKWLQLSLILQHWSIEKEEKGGKELLINGPKSSYRMKLNSVFQGPRVSRGTESKSRLNFPQSVVMWFAMSSASVGPLCFIKSKVNADIYQDILDYFMLPSAADFPFPGWLKACSQCWNCHQVTWPEPLLINFRKYPNDKRY